ncbi:MAG: DUF2905 domain-containing protein [Balneolales bacterium]
MMRFFIMTGVIFIIVGILLHMIPGLFNWLGRLPGDIRIESGERSRFHLPFTSMIVISIILTLLLNFLRRLLS